MITGTHILLYSQNAEADRAFLRDVLGFRSVDAGGGWLIFGLPPAELGIHPASGAAAQAHAEQELLACVLYLMCDDIRQTIDSLKAKGLECSAIQEAQWGRSTAVKLPSGGRIGLYQPAHPTAIDAG